MKPAVWRNLAEHKPKQGLTRVLVRKVNSPSYGHKSILEVEGYTYRGWDEVDIWGMGAGNGATFKRADIEWLDESYDIS